ncbi:MAG: hypothetical protein ACI8SE_001065 [Bacteroidia bacterium]
MFHWIVSLALGIETKGESSATKKITNAATNVTPIAQPKSARPNFRLLTMLNFIRISLSVLIILIQSLAITEKIEMVEIITKAYPNVNGTIKEAKNISKMATRNKFLRVNGFVFDKATQNAELKFENV